MLKIFQNATPCALNESVLIFSIEKRSEESPYNAMRS